MLGSGLLMAGVGVDTGVCVGVGVAIVVIAMGVGRRWGCEGGGTVVKG